MASLDDYVDVEELVYEPNELGVAVTNEIVYVECDRCNEESLPATYRIGAGPWTRGHKCENCGMRY